ncbi:WD40 repeat-like protein, partial [Sistotremastrum niveocremeum HHB9708]
GMAGTGKTTIAYSFCEYLLQQNFLGASFFCSRAIEETRQVHQIIPTIVNTLASNQHLPTRLTSSIIDALAHDDNLANTAMLEKQCQALLFDPVKISMQGLGFFPIIIIDALDECSDLEQVHRFLQTLFRHAPSLPVKFFVSSRPETEHQRYRAAHLHHSFILHNIERDLVKADITKYLNDKFSSLNTYSQEISDNDVNALAEQADKLFIFAATAYKFISDPLINDPHGRLQLLLESDWETSPLDSLYSQIIGDLFARLRPSQHMSMQHVIRIIIAASEPLTSQCIASLLMGDMSANGDTVKRQVEALQSVFYMTPEDIPQISPFHASFPDFLSQESRSKQYFLESGQSHHMLTRQCFTLLNGFFTTKQFVSIHPSTLITPTSDALRYSSSFWAFHLSGCNDIDVEVQNLLSWFLKNHILHWLEYLHYLGQLHIAGRYPSLLSLVVDAHRFLLENYDMISKHPEELYRSALLWLPNNSEMRSHYVTQRSSAHWPQVIKGLHLTWGVTQHTLTGHAHGVACIAFSPLGQHIASASDDRTLRIWDTATGQQKQMMKGHSKPLSCVKYSPDGWHIATCANDRTVIIWDTATGHEEQVLKGHLKVVSSVAYSPDGKYIASASHDKTVRIWDIATGYQDQVLNGHLDRVLSVAYSPDGNYIASASADKTVIVWDAVTGQQKQCFEGHSLPLHCVVYSPDGQHIASGSDDQTIRIWDTTAVQKELFEHHSGMVMSVTYSHCGQHIVSASDDRTVRIWDTTTGQQEHLLKGHTDSVRSVAYSPDDQHIASGSADKSVRIWEVATGHQKQVLNGHLHWVSSVVYSPDGQHIATASSDKTVIIWDITTGHQEQVLKGHLDWVASVAYSPNGQHIVSGSDDQTIIIWDAVTGQQEQQLGGHSEWFTVQSVAYSPDGQHIASHSKDNVITIWNVAT